MEKELRTYPFQTRFRSLKSKLNGQSTFMVNDTGVPISLWDISNPDMPIIQEFSKEGEHYMFGVNTDELKEFFLFNSDN